MEDRLLGAMERLLSQGQSFSSLTVEALASEAKISRATFYLRFNEKNALVATLLARISDDIVASSGTWFNANDHADPTMILLALRGVVHAFKRHQSILAAVAETAPFDANVAALHQRMLDGFRAKSRAAFARARAQGRATAWATDSLADLLTDMIELYCSRHLRSLEGEALEELARQLAHLSSSAIFSPEVLKNAAKAEFDPGHAARSKS